MGMVFAVNPTADKTAAAFLAAAKALATEADLAQPSGGPHAHPSGSPPGPPPGGPHDGGPGNGVPGRESSVATALAVVGLLAGLMW